MIFDVVLVLCLVISIVVNINLYFELKKTKTHKTPGHELSEFLQQDFKTHGYSFVRIDPDHVFLRK